MIVAENENDKPKSLRHKWKKRKQVTKKTAVHDMYISPAVYIFTVRGRT